MIRVALAALMLAACSSGLPSDPCSAHGNAPSCSADPACGVVGCPACGGSITFRECVSKGKTVQIDCAPPQCAYCNSLDPNACAAASAQGCRVNNCCGTLSCLGPGDPAVGCTCASCHGLDAASCAAASAQGCRPHSCCNTFQACLDPGENAVCSGACPISVCSTFTDAATCAAQPDCHAVYQPGNACGCAPVGCCTFFSSCAPGKTADCKGPAGCLISSPVCEGPYVVSYAGACYEGCVLQSECAP